MYVCIIDNEGDEIYSTLPENLTSAFENCKVENQTFIKDGKKYRDGKVSNSNGSAYLITDEREIVERPRFFKEKLQVYLDFIPTIKSVEHRARAKAETHNKRLLHDLTALNGHNIQEVFNIIPEEELRTKKEGRKKFIEDQIKQQIQKVPDMIMNIMKNNAGIKMEFSVAEKLYGANHKIEKQKHNVRRALMNILHLFFQDFADKGIYVNIEESDTEIMLDYGIFQVAMYQIFDNAVKYAMNNSDIKISFFMKDTYFCLAIDMTSLKMEEDELSKLTQEGFCGRQAKKLKKNGKGIGLFNVKKVLTLMHIKLDIFPLNKDQTILNGVEYGNNRFLIKFPKNLLVS